MKSWPQSEMPREKLLSRGPQQLSDAELLAVLLGTGSRGQSAVAMGRDLLIRYGTIADLLNAQEAELGAIEGMGPAKMARLYASKEIGLRLEFKNILSKEVLTNTKATRRFLRNKYRHSDVEVFCGIFLDAQHQVLAFEELFKGTIDGAAVYPREVVKSCLQHQAAAMIFAHNHPSGVAEPSQADVAITLKLKAALEAIDVRVLDHLVIGNHEVVSFAERSLL